MKIAAGLIDDDDRVHHFGSVVATAGRKLDHKYHLVNHTQKSVKIVNVVNRKPCCGVVAVGKTTLAPDEATDVVVTLSVGGRFGDVTHEAVVVTDDDPPQELVLRTVAQACPPLRVEEVGSAIATTPLTGGSRRVECLVKAYGASGKPPLDLDRLKLDATVDAGWVGVKESGIAEDDLTVESRRFYAVLDGHGKPGARTAAVGLLDGKNKVFEHVLNWEVVPPITASPKLLVIRPGTRAYPFILQSRDGKAFRVAPLASNDAGLTLQIPSAEALLTQKVTVDVTATPKSAAVPKVLTLETDHPAMAKVEIPVVVIE